MGMRLVLADYEKQGVAEEELVLCFEIMEPFWLWLSVADTADSETKRAWQRNLCLSGPPSPPDGPCNSDAGHSG